METFETLDEIESAYEQLLSLQRDLNAEVESDDTNWDDLVQAIEEQTSLMETIQESNEVDETFRTQRSERFRTIMEDLKSLREKLILEIKNQKDEIKNELDSLDQTMTLLDEYQQETGSSYHLDQTI